jgi:CRP-like cAMP-binding protein
MMTENVERILRSLPFFSGMKDEHVATVAGCAKNCSFDPGATIFHQGEDADFVYVIRSGKVAVDVDVVTEGPVTIQTLESDEVLGWSWLIPPYVWNFSARAVEPVHALALDGRCLRGKCDADSDLGYDLLKRFAEVIVMRLRATRLQLMDMYGPATK